MPFQFVEEYFNDFDDGVVAPLVFTDPTGLGNVSEAGTQLTLNQLGLNNWQAFLATPCAATHDRTEGTEVGKFVRYELKVDSVTMDPGIKCGMHLGPTDQTRALQVGFRRDLSTGDYYYWAQRIQPTINLTDVDQLIGSSAPGVHWFRVYLNDSGSVKTIPEAGSPTISDNQYALYVSTDGVSYTQLHLGTSGTGGNKSDAGVFAAQWPASTTPPPRESQIVCDWLRIENWELVLGDRRVYVAGGNGFNSQSGAFDADDLLYKAFPQLSGWGNIRAIGGLANDDIWVGRDGPSSGHPWLAHFDGVAYTEYEVTAIPATGIWRVAGILAISTNEVYALIGNNTAMLGAIIKWDGVSWSKVTDTISVSSNGSYQQDLFGDAGDNLYTTHADGTVGYWNGSTFATGSPSGQPLVGGCMRNDGTVFVLDDDGDFYKKGATIGDWTLERDINNFANNSFGIRSRVWHNSDTDDVWTLTYTTNNFNPVLSKWDGSSWTDEDVQSVAIRFSAVEGVLRDDGAQIWLAYETSGATVHAKDPTTGLWSANIQPGYIPYAIFGHEEPAPAPTDPFTVTNKDPSPGQIHVEKNRTIVFHLEVVVDPIDLARVTVKVRGDVVYQDQQFASGWADSEVLPIDGGNYKFKLVPSRSQYHRANEQTYVTVLHDTTVIDAWFFVAGKGLPFSVYRFILGSIRTLDEENN